MIQRMEPAESKLPYPTRPLKVQGGTVEEYIIPKDKSVERESQRGS
jgi:hypothetical protein